MFPRRVPRQLVLGGVRGGAARGRGVASGLGAPLRQPAGAARVRQVRLLLAEPEGDQVTTPPTLFEDLRGTRVMAVIAKGLDIPVFRNTR